MISPAAQYPVMPVGRIAVLEWGAMPSTDIYLRSRLDGPGMPPAHYVDMESADPAQVAMTTQPGEGLFVVICRYIDGAWLKWLAARRHRLAGVAFFADDDLPAMMRDAALPWRYRRKIRRLYGRRVRRLSALCSELWVSGPALAERYAEASPRILPPLFVGDAARRQRTVRYFYHGTASHGAEIEWLHDVVALVQARNPDTAFEIFGDRRVRDLYAGIDRVTVLHPMGWPSYLAHSESSARDIGLAPLLPGPVNDARSHTRFFDIARAGAVGIYADRPPYAGFVRDRDDGLLLPDDKRAWAEAILALAEDEPRRRRMAGGARLRLTRHDNLLAFLAPPGLTRLEAAE